MTRVVILGNSHLGALYAAWNDMPNRPYATEIKFFGGIAPIFAMMSLDSSGRFGLTDPARTTPEALEHSRKLFGSTSIDLTDSDAVVLAGVDWKVWDLLSLIGTFAIDPLGNGGRDEPRLSETAFLAVLSGLAEAALAPLEWTARVAAPVIVLPRPIPSESTIADGHATASRLTRATQRGLAPALSLLEAAVAEGAASRGLTWLPQPAASRADTGLTRAAMQRGSRRLRDAIVDAKAGQTKDYEHMNADYGAMALAALLAALPSVGRPSNAPSRPQINALGG